MENIKGSINDVVGIIEHSYIYHIEQLNKKLENIHRINYSSLESLIEKEIKAKNIKSKNDIVKYVESIISD